MSIATPNHVAVLVPSVRRAAEFLRQFPCQIGKEEEFEHEGTREVYVNAGQANALLLMEAIAPGPYLRAFEKRGPGFHHFAVDVLNLESYLDSVVTAGWLLHPISRQTVAKTRSAYLSRPGFPGLIEVKERRQFNEGPLFVSGVSLKMEAGHVGLLKPVGLDAFVVPGAVDTLSLAGHTFDLKNLWCTTSSENLTIP